MVTNKQRGLVTRNWAKLANNLLSATEKVNFKDNIQGKAESSLGKGCFIASHVLNIYIYFASELRQYVAKIFFGKCLKKKVRAVLNRLTSLTLKYCGVWKIDN